MAVGETHHFRKPPCGECGEGGASMISDQFCVFVSFGHVFLMVPAVYG